MGLVFESLVFSEDVLATGTVTATEPEHNTQGFSFPKL